MRGSPFCGHAFPQRTSQTGEALSKLVTAGMVRVYEYDRQPFLQLENWSKHQSVRNKRSKYPDPNTIEINCKQLHANVPVIQSLSESVSLSESESETRATPGATAPDRPHTEPDEPPTKKPPSAQERRFDEFWNFYPRKIGKGAAAKAYQKIKPDDALHKTILAAIVLAKKFPAMDGERRAVHPEPGNMAEPRAVGGRAGHRRKERHEWSQSSQSSTRSSWQCRTM